MNEIFDSVNLVSVTLFVVSAGVMIVGIELSFKAIQLGTRAISKS